VVVLIFFKGESSMLAKQEEVGKGQGTSQRGRGYPRGRGHWGARNGNGPWKSFFYYRCVEEGHKASECPNMMLKRGDKLQSL